MVSKNIFKKNTSHKVPYLKREKKKENTRQSRSYNRIFAIFTQLFWYNLKYLPGNPGQMLFIHYITKLLYDSLEGIKGQIGTHIESRESRQHCRTVCESEGMFLFPRLSGSHCDDFACFSFIWRWTAVGLITIIMYFLPL